MILSDQVIIAIVLVTLISSYLIQNLADYLNIGNLDPQLPASFSDVYDARRYEKSQLYLKTTTRLGVITSSLDLALLLIFWFWEGFGLLDQFVRQLTDSPILAGLLFMGILAALKFIISLPFNIYRTFVIEARFGFNKTTPKTFVLDTVKTILLGLGLGAVILTAIFWFFNFCGPWAWLLCWIATSIFLISLQYIVPTWIMPLFNTFTPLEEGELKTAIFTYARSIDFPLTQIFVMDGSKRSAKSNAFFTGFGKNRRIVLFDTLIQEQGTEELLAVLAHEMGHFKKKHIQRRLVMGIAQMGIIFYLLSLFLSHQGLFNAFFVPQPSVYAGLIFFSILYSPIDMALSLVMQAVSRKDEREADQFAADSTKNPGALVSALKKLAAHNLSNLTPHPFYVFLNYSHPPVLERIARLQGNR